MNKNVDNTVYPEITTDVVKDYISDAKTFALRMGLGAALFIICPVLPVIGAFRLVSIFTALFGMFALIFLGIFFLIYGAIDFAKWSYLKKEKRLLDSEAMEYVKDENANYGSAFASRLTLGIMMICLCWFPLVLLTRKSGLIYSLVGRSTVLGLSILFFMIGYGLLLIIVTAITKGIYSGLVRMNLRHSR